MKQTIEVEQYICDGCAKAFTVPTFDGPPIPWFNGTVILHHGGGGSGGDWDACSEKCVRKAIVMAIDRD